MSKPGIPDAGLRSHDHYKSRLPRWRYNLRQSFIPLVRAETPYLAWAQHKLRCPALDSYFAITANLGTHTFFMIFLPILYWCGFTYLARGLVHILGTGVLFSGYIKDLLCLPRPLSPPLQRITMSGSAALEYGCPSTHTTNAISVVVFAIVNLSSPESTVPPNTRLLIEVFLYIYAISIILGRLYCGMHGFLDVIIGGLVGAFVAGVQCLYGQSMDEYLWSGSPGVCLTVLVGTFIALVRMHPEPADDCPCFDDSVAFSGVIIGCELGNWHYALSGWAWDFPVLATVPFSIEDIGWPKLVIRLLFGIVVTFAWRSIMKPTLLKSLPPLFRVIERLGLNLPRRFFIQASEYKNVPFHLINDNVIPSVSEFPSIMTSLRHPRNRSVSVGPQSAADVHETLAYREKKRREGTSSKNINTSGHQRGGEDVSDCHADLNADPGKGPKELNATSASAASSSKPSLRGFLPSPTLSKVETYEQMMGESPTVYAPLDPTPESPAITIGSTGLPQSNSNDKTEHDRDKREMFLALEKPRVRYDVEVVTKLIVYTGTYHVPPILSRNIQSLLI
ncbi:MAG: hypothetical protein M1837_003238 [Sclerophora amabilis]|nr:MAG: hypothetical protein M1837_003238 [Sclerophora amabilis]